MASGTFTIPNKGLLNLVNATDLLAQATFKLSLHTSSWTPADTTDEVYADVTNEIANGNGYTTGGITLSNVTLTRSGAVVTFTCDPAIWTASGGSIPAWRHGVIRAVGTINGKVDPLLGHFLGDSTPADVPATTDTNTLTFTPNASGIVAITKSP